MAWQPLEEPIRQLSGYLKDSLSGHDQNAQKYATQVSIHHETSYCSLTPGIMLYQLD
jgi:hypothetical protein